MDNEAETSAVARLERAIESLEAVVSDQRRAYGAATSAASDAATERNDLSRRHEALKTAVATCIGDIDTLLESGGLVSGGRADA